MYLTRDSVENGTIVLQKIPTSQNLADNFNNVTDKPILKAFTEQVL